MRWSDGTKPRGRARNEGLLAGWLSGFSGALGVARDDLREVSPWAFGTLEMLMAINGRAVNSVLQTQTIQGAQQCCALRSRHTGLIKIADQADADVELVDLIIARMRTLILQRTAFINCAAHVDDEMITDASPWFGVIRTFDMIEIDLTQPRCAFRVNIIFITTVMNRNDVGSSSHRFGATQNDGLLRPFGS